ncbi:hypothetical protein M513_10767 [Trichuris suis]|uniref:Uncharacterized protein n=1 Tax=Trichuris suis TaxID=68888 RepID=A0A085LTQ9_9BILA|nr:hypothetical protein M513_10767 [Trichuris suis]
MESMTRTWFKLHIKKAHVQYLWHIHLPTGYVYAIYGMHVTPVDPILFKLGRQMCRGSSVVGNATMSNDLGICLFKCLLFDYAFTVSREEHLKFLDQVKDNLLRHGCPVSTVLVRSSANEVMHNKEVV